MKRLYHILTIAGWMLCLFCASRAFAQTGAPPEVLQYGGREVCTEYALAMVELADRYREILSAEKG